MTKYVADSPPLSANPADLREYIYREFLRIQDSFETTNDWLAMTDFFIDVSRGAIKGYATVNKFGEDPTLGSGATNEVWDGSVAYTWPTTASITHLRAAVDSATTRGVDIEIHGVDTNYDLVTQTVTTDGTDSTTEVALTTALRRVFRMIVLDSSVMDQAIQVGPTGFASFQAQISIGNNQTLMAIYTVPNGKTAYVTKYYFSNNKVAGGGAPEVLMKLWARDNVNGYAPQIKHVVGTDADATSYVVHEFKPYFKATQKTDIYLEATEITGGGGVVSDVTAGFDLILVNDSVG